MNVLPLPGVLLQLDFAAQQVRQLAADRQTQTGAAVLAAGSCICLLERLENDPLLLDGNSNPRIGNLERNHRRRRSR